MFRRTFAAALPLALFAPPSRAQAAKKLVVYTSNDSTLNDLVFARLPQRDRHRGRAGGGRLGRRHAPPAGREGAAAGRHRVGREPLAAADQQDAVRALRLEEQATPRRPSIRDPDNLWIGNNLHLLVILQNTKIVPEAEGPKSWADLLDPKWKGKIAFTDPANSGSAYATVTMLVDLWGGGEAGWKKVAAAVQEHEGAQSLLAGLPGRRQRRVSARHLARICRPAVGPGRRAGEGDLSGRRHHRLDGRRRHHQGRPEHRERQGSSSTTSTARTCAR